MKILIVVKMLFDGCLKLDYRFLNTKSDAPPTCGGMKVTVRYPQDLLGTLPSSNLDVHWTALFYFIFLFTNFEICTSSSGHQLSQNFEILLAISKILELLRDTFPSSLSAKFIFCCTNNDRLILKILQSLEYTLPP